MNTKLVLVSFLMVLSIVFIGCKNPANPYVTDNDAGNGSEDNGDSNGNGGLPTPGTGNPLNVSVHLSTISARSVITSEGGNIQLIDPNGNTVTLNIPENAVYKEEITMTLISSLDGATLSGGILSGVDIQPDGLQLLKPGTLTIEPQDPDIISELLSVDSDYLLTTFAYRGDGSDFHYYPYRITGNKIELNIFGFSGYGGGRSNEGDRTTQNEHSPSDPKDRASQDIAEILNEEKLEQAKDPSYEPPEEHQERITEALRQWLYEYVIPLAEAAEANHLLVHCAVTEWLTWEATAQILGVLQHDNSPFSTEINKIVNHTKKGYENAMAKSHQRAISNNDPSEIVYVLMLEAESQMLDFNIDASEILAKIARFEFEFDSTIEETTGGYRIAVETETIPMVFAFDELRFVGMGPIYHVEFGYECGIDHSLTPSTFFVDTHSIPIQSPNVPSCNGKSTPRPPMPDDLDFTLWIVPGTPMETVTIQCDPEDEPFTFGPAPIWAGSFGNMHSEYLVPEHGFAISGWDITYGRPYAAIAINRSDDMLTSETRLTLWYAPIP